MTITPRRLAALAAPALLAASLTACGAGGPPTDATNDAFCAEYNGPIEELAGSATSGEAPAAGDIYSTLQDQATGLEEVGTPENISDDAREGFEIYVEEVQGVDEGEFTEAYESDEDPDDAGLVNLSDDDEDRVDDFTEYAEDTCGAPAVS